MLKEIKSASFQEEPVWALGMMSGTSLDGIDLALLRTDGHSIADYGACYSYPIDASLQSALRGLMYGEGDALLIEKEYTLYVASCINDFVQHHAMIPSADIAACGFHGQTITHRPAEGITWQIGNASLLCERTGLLTVSDFRRRDMAAGGQGAPLACMYHAALAKQLAPSPVAMVNIGGVANVTWVHGDHIHAFDTGPGNAAINDWVSGHTGLAFDESGMLATRGNIHSNIVSACMHFPYFALKPPKSLDRDSFTKELVSDLSLEDGAATLTRITVESIARSVEFMPSPPHTWLVCGGGRHNKTIMKGLAALLPNVQPVEAVGWRGDALEAEAFAYLSIRALKCLPLSLPQTTGVTRPLTGGAFCLPLTDDLT